MRMKTIFVLYCLFYATGTEGTTINVRGFERGEVSFQCSHRFAWNANKYLCKYPCKVTGDILVTAESGKTAESGRISLVDFGSGLFTVTFSQLRQSDSGVYFCGVSRSGLDTFIEVHLTVEEAVETTVITEFSTTRIYQNISTSALLPSTIDSSQPTNLSEALNCTNGGGQSFSTGTVLYATTGTVTTLSVLVLATCFRKCRKKTQPHVCSDSIVRAEESKNYCEELQPMRKLPERFSCPHHPEQEPPTFAPSTAADNVSLHIYENLCLSKVTADLSLSAANVQDEHDTGSVLQVTSLPPVISEKAGDGCLGKHMSKSTETKHVTSNPTESHTSACHSRSCSDSKEERPRSLWFGLDLSGIAQV